MAINPKSLENLQPAKKGDVRNPNGKPRGIPNAKTRYLRLLTLTEKIKNPVTGEVEEFSIMEQLDMQMIAKARKGDIRAYQEIMDRLEGKPKQSQTIELTKSPAREVLEAMGMLEGEDNDGQTTTDTQSPSDSTPQV